MFDWFVFDAEFKKLSQVGRWLDVPGLGSTKDKLFKTWFESDGDGVGVALKGKFDLTVIVDGEVFDSRLTKVLHWHKSPLLCYCVLSFCLSSILSRRHP